MGEEWTGEERRKGEERRGADKSEISKASIEGAMLGALEIARNEAHAFHLIREAVFHFHTGHPRAILHTQIVRFSIDADNHISACAKVRVSPYGGRREYDSFIVEVVYEGLQKVERGAG